MTLEIQCYIFVTNSKGKFLVKMANGNVNILQTAVFT